MAGAGSPPEVLARAVAPGAVVHAANPRIVLVGSNDAWNVRLTRPAARTSSASDRDPDELQALVRDLSSAESLRRVGAPEAATLSMSAGKMPGMSV